MVLNNLPGNGTWKVEIVSSHYFCCLEAMEHDHYMYAQRNKKFFMFLSLFVDHILLARKIGDVRNTKSWLFSKFDMNDMHEASYMLGGRIIRDHSKKLLGMFQVNMFLRSLSDFWGIRHFNWKRACPKPEWFPKIDNEKNRMSKVSHANAIGSLFYVVDSTKPQFCY